MLLYFCVMYIVKYTQEENKKGKIQIISGLDVFIPDPSRIHAVS